MAYTVQQAQQAIAAQEAPPADTGNPFGGSGNGAADLQQAWNDYQQVLLTGKLSNLGAGSDFNAELDALVQAGWISQQQRDQVLALAGGNTPTVSPVSTLYPYDPQTGYIGRYPASSPTGDSHFQGPVNTYIDPQTGLLYNANGTLLPEYLQKSLGGGIGGGGGGGTYSQSAAYLQSQQAEAKREFDQQQALAQQQANQGYINQRAGIGLNLGQFVNSLAQDQYNYAKDPGNYPAYLAAQSGLPQGQGSPISQLLGQGVEISPPAGSNPLADPRFQNLLGELYGVSNPTSLETVQNIAAANGGQLPQSFYDYTHTINPNVPAHAHGGSQMLNEPVIGIGLHTGQPRFLAGEAGQEKVSFHPVHTHNDGSGKMPVPHMHAMGDITHEHTGPNAQPTFKGYAMGGDATAGQQFTPHELISAYNAYHPNAQMADTNFTPSEATNMSLAKALKPLGYVPQYVIDQLSQGRSPTPGSIDEATWMRLPPSLQQLLQAGVQAQVGSTGLQDYLGAMAQNTMPGLNNGRVGVSYA